MTEKFQTKLMFAVFGMAFCAGMLVTTTFWGDPANVLDTAGQYWSFIGFFGFAAGVGFKEIAPMLPFFKTPEKPATTTA